MSEAEPIIHESGCGWETGPYCTCGADQERMEFSPFPPHLSPSQISSLLTCGEQFRLTRLLRVPQRPMWAGIGGSVVHKLTEELDREWYATHHPQAG